MDATDHENIPSPGESSGLSSWMHIGFDYLKREAENPRNPVQILSKKTEHCKSEKIVTVEKNQSLTESYTSGSQNSKIGPCKNSKMLKYTNEDSGLESASSTNSSPATSPQGSPSTKRRQEYNLSSNAQAVSCYNPISWIYKGLFSQESESLNSAVKVSCIHKDSPGSERKKGSLPSDSGRRKYIITNFDINALSPQSW